MTTREILVKARALIEDPERWTQGAWARDAWGNKTLDSRDNAVAFCVAGAMCRVSGDMVPRDAWAAFELAAGDGISRFNDAQTHADVLAVLDKAIAECES